MASYKVKGAGDSRDGNNPPVHSKGQRHGIPYHPTPVARPGGVAAAPHTGSKIKGFTEYGAHQLPVENRTKEGSHIVTHHHPSTLGSAMAEGKHHAHSQNTKYTDHIEKHGPTRVGSQLDSDAYVGGNRGKGPSEK